MLNTKNEIKIINLTYDFIDEFAVLMDEYRVFYGKQSNFNESKQYVSHLLKDKKVIFLMAITGDKRSIGFCTLFQSYSSVQVKKIFILNDLYVHKNHRHHGYGTKLLDAAITLAKREKVKFLKLETAKDNVTAQSVYEKHGWKLSEFLSYGINVKEK